jgi:hypothetical protein
MAEPVLKVRRDGERRGLHNFPGVLQNHVARHFRRRVQVPPGESAAGAGGGQRFEPVPPEFWHFPRQGLGINTGRSCRSSRLNFSSRVAVMFCLETWLCQNAPGCLPGVPYAWMRYLGAVAVSDTGNLSAGA